MPDIQMCHDFECPSRRKCYRNPQSGTLPSFWQAMGGHPEIDKETGKCENFMELYSSAPATMEGALLTAIKVLTSMHNNYRQNPKGIPQTGYHDARSYCSHSLKAVINMGDSDRVHLKSILSAFLDSYLEFDVLEGMETYKEGYLTGLKSVVTGVCSIMWSQPTVLNWLGPADSLNSSGETYA